MPRLHCLVAEVRGEVVGYATCALEMSTWAGREYLHMDCLFLRDGYRGAGLGAQLVDAVLAVARHFGVAAAEWQTPPWNAGAVRFYERLGGRARPKVRFTLTTSDATPPVRDE
ncbi:Acetyltransferase (GNAT) family protein [Asanoa ishikariensis]|uniref:Acetyltransferase (GNAT) family protein n=1 Tax=Asanoa ishikariensis TaxID=137265 RepID=A0A1H3USP3_9ACTN|nr:Acetyltransferase (GNAT) family protein [Asanoa ishikariensis]